jgi:sulfur relay (sulfurtransferase) DsrC/TusE family protein
MTLHATDHGLAFDRDGFMLEPTRWDQSIAQRIADLDGYGALGALQMTLLLSLRQEFSKHHEVSALSHICHLHGLEADCLQTVFPSPRVAWRLAGLPNPGEEAKAYLG